MVKIFVLSLHTQNDGAIAQLVEQRTENPCVPGSIPGGTTKNRKLRNQLPIFCFTLPTLHNKFSRCFLYTYNIPYRV